jgi:Holliday junction resolvasome RuvABC DNA-binding subunit
MKQSTKEIILDSGIDMLDPEIEVVEVEKITKEMKKSILSIEHVSKENIKQLVALFYQIQDIRIHTSEQIRAIKKQIESNKIAKTDGDGNLIALNWVLQSTAATEKGINNILKEMCKSDEVGRWLLSIYGIGPALAAGCLSYFDVTGINYASNFISYAGLNSNNRPWLGREKSKKIVDEVIAKYDDGNKKTVTITDDMVIEIAAKTQWKFEYFVENARSDKGKWSKEALIKAAAKIPYNANLKTHMWKVGKSFEYLKTNKNSLYGKLLAERIVLETKRNEEGYYKDYIKQKMSEKNYSTGTETYKCYMEGKLPAVEINARCRRWVQKIFVSHLFEEMYRVANDKVPPRYYALEHCENQHNRDIAPEVPYTLVSSEK